MDRDDAESRKRAEVRRKRFRGLMDQLQVVLTDSAERPVEKRQIHMAAVADPLVMAIDDHIRDTEEDGGFFEEMLENAPRLSDRVQAMRDDHRTLRRDAKALCASLTSEPSANSVAASHQAATTLLADLEHHHELGAELLYDCYWIDVATGD